MKMLKSGTNLLMSLFIISFIAIQVIGQNDTNPTNQTLKFLIPRRDLEDFVRVRKLSNGTLVFSGFSISVFREAAELAISSRKFVFEPYTNEDGTMKGTFDDMLREVQNNTNYEGAVGEITILNNRMDLVDFTTPYLDSEIGILVRRTQLNENSERVAAGLTPITKIILVLVGVLSFGILVAVVVWIWKLSKFKHASSSTQPSGSTLGSKMHTRLMVILVLMVLLLTIASYTPRQPTDSTLQTSRVANDIKTIDDLIRKGSMVGYRQGAFVKDLLIAKGLQASQLKEMNSDDELLDKLKKGGQENGIDALVAGTHNLKLFQENSCANFTLVEDFRLKSAGLGFAFRKDRNPSLVNEFSKAIVGLIDSGRMEEIQARTIGDLDKKCLNTETTVNSRLSVEDRISQWLPVASAIFVVVLVLAMLLSYFEILWMKK